MLTAVQFVPQYNTYTCYKDVDQDEGGNTGAPAPSGQYRHATYTIRDPYQQQIAQQSSSKNGQVRAAATLSAFAPPRLSLDLARLG
jgi:hypothetical protein